jgi:hypothetical protein
LKFTPNDRASLLLDFSRPSLLNFGSQPSSPTPNNSNWFVTGETESWSTSLGARLKEFFGERATQIDWLHRDGTYDALLLVLGLPLSLWGSYRLGHGVTTKLNLPFVITTAVYVYTLVLSLNVFRALFSYARWVFPKIELESKKSAAGQHRALWTTLVIGVIVCAIWDGIKALS